MKEIVTLEPAAPPIRGVDNAKVAYTGGGGLSWGVANSPITYEPAVKDASELRTVLEEAAPAPDKVPCYVQQEPARRLRNLPCVLHVRRHHESNARPRVTISSVEPVANARQ